MQSWTMAKAQRSRKKAVMAACSTFQLDRLLVERSSLHFPCLIHASEGIFHTMAKLPTGNWTVEVFCRAVGLDVRCSVWAEQSKIPVAVAPMPGAYLSTGRTFIPIRGIMKNFLSDTNKHTQLKCRGRPGPRRFRARDPWQEYSGFPVLAIILCLDTKSHRCGGVLGLTVHSCLVYVLSTLTPYLLFYAILSVSSYDVLSPRL